MKRSGFSLGKLFGGRPKLCLGLDIGSHAVKVCELARGRDGIRLLSLGSARLPEGAVEDGLLQAPDVVGETVARLLGNLKIKNKKVAISISGYSVIVKKINLPVMDDAAMEEHIRAEAEQYIPFDIDEVFVDFRNLHTDRGESDRTEVLLVAAKRDVVNAYLEMLAAIGLTASVVDVDVFALQNAYAENAGSETNLALVDIGASKMSINMIVDGVSVLARDVALGGSQLTARIEGRLDISAEEAEAVKIGASPVAEDKRQEVETVFAEFCEQWAGELDKAFANLAANLQRNAGEGEADAIHTIVLSGGGSRIQGFDQLLSKTLGRQCRHLDPFAKVSFDHKRIDPEYVRYMSSEMAIAVGLALRETEA